MNNCAVANRFIQMWEYPGGRPFIYTLLYIHPPIIPTFFKEYRVSRDAVCYLSRCYLSQFVFGGKIQTMEGCSQELNRKKLKRKYILDSEDESESECEPTEEDRLFIDDTVVDDVERHEGQPDHDYVAPDSLASIAMRSITDPAAALREPEDVACVFLAEAEPEAEPEPAEVWLERPIAGLTEPGEYTYPKTRRRADIPLIPEYPTPLQKEHLAITYQQYNERYPLEIGRYRELYYRQMLGAYKLAEPSVLDKAGLPPECGGLTAKDAIAYLLEHYPTPFLNTAPRGFFTQAFAEDVEAMRHQTRKCFSIEGCAKGTPKRYLDKRVFFKIIANLILFYLFRAKHMLFTTSYYEMLASIGLFIEFVTKLRNQFEGVYLWPMVDQTLAVVALRYNNLEVQRPPGFMESYRVVEVLKLIGTVEREALDIYGCYACEADKDCKLDMGYWRDLCIAQGLTYPEDVFSYIACVKDPTLQRHYRLLYRLPGDIIKHVENACNVARISYKSQPKQLTVIGGFKLLGYFLDSGAHHQVTCQLNSPYHRPPNLIIPQVHYRGIS